MSIKRSVRLLSAAAAVALVSSSAVLPQTGPQFAIVATPASGITTDKMGGTAILAVRLACNYSPCLTATVQVQVRSDNATQALVRLPGGVASSSVSLSFQQGTYYTDQTVEVLGRDDGLQNGPTAYTVTLLAGSSDSRINGLTRTVSAVNADRTDHNVCVSSVPDQFWAIPSVLEKLPIRFEIPPVADFYCGGPDNSVDFWECPRHFQGAARTKHGPYLIVTGNGSTWSQFFVNKLAAKQGLTGRWGNNFTTWDDDVQPNYPSAYQISSTYAHAGAPSLFGDFAAIPLEGDGPGSLVHFYDLFDPEHPLWLSQATLVRPSYENAGAAAVTKLNGRYLVAVMSNNPAEIQFYLSSGGDIRQSQGWTFLGAWSTEQHGYPYECLGNPSWAATIQSVSFIEQCDGTLYLGVMYNEGDSGCNFGSGHNWARLYRVSTAGLLGGDANNALIDAGGRTFSCKTDVLDYCNFGAAAGFHVSAATRRLMIYSTWYYVEALWTSLQEWIYFILGAEFADEDSPPGHTVLIPKQAKPAIEDGTLVVGREGPDYCPLGRCDSDPVNSLRARNVLLGDVHYLRVQFQPNGAWNAVPPAPFAQVDDNTRARLVPGPWPYVFDVYPTPARDPAYPATGPTGDPSWNAYFGTLRFVEQDDEGDNFGSTAYNGWPRGWTDWKVECSQRASGSADKNGLGLRFWATGTDVSATSTAILRDASVCIVDDSPGSITPAWRVTVKRKSQNLAPALDVVGPKSVIEGSNLSFTVHGTDANDDTLTYSATGMPAGATLNAVSGLFTWTPGYAQAGTYTVTFSCSDGLAQGSQTATITVQNVNVAPVLAPIGNKTAYIGTVFTLRLSATDADGGPLTYSASPLPPGATFNASTGTMSWTLSGTATYASSYTVTFRVTDPTGLSDSETIVIYVRTLSCLLAGAPIEMADGTLRPIESVRPGDLVRSYDETSGTFTASPVRAVATGSSAMHLVVNGSLRLTEKHPLRVGGHWVEAGDLQVGDLLLRSDGTAEIVRSIDLVEREEPVYTLEVEGTHTFCAGGMVVHNKPPPGD